MSPFEALVLIREAQSRYSRGGDMTYWFQLVAQLVHRTATAEDIPALFGPEGREPRIDAEFSNLELRYASMMQNVISTGLKMGEVFIARPNMCQLIEGIWPSMPEQALIKSDLPSESGVLFFDEPIRLDDVYSYPPISGVVWCSATLRHITASDVFLQRGGSMDGPNTLNLEMGAGLWIIFFVDTKSSDMAKHVAACRGRGLTEAKVWLNSCPRILLYDVRMYPFGKAPLAYVHSAFGRVEERSPMAARMQTFFALCKQELPAIERHDPTLKEQKLMRRMDLRNRAISVITLRRHKGDQGNNDTEVEWSHRWIVRAHWRNQYYPSEGIHRAIPILPYIKGPEDKPLVIHDKVNILGR